ncbi:hypothetical protein ACTHPJ_13520 [Paenibacillus amylolyticus]|uniref:hypothetical protein n=1 Tax=Paenibacillus amylolyticus TaxID=1451 RepID=UPI003F7FE987
MNNLTAELHSLIYKNTIWPSDLLENLTDPSYLSVNFETYLNGLCGKIVFVDEGKAIEAYYYFNEKNFIQKVEMIEDDRTTVLYDRIEEIAKVLLKYDRFEEFEETIKLLAA